ncbi:MAG TPA: nuclear transport factor 2 family protein [Thermoanaerobaculia bacterium]|jgi:ketosteroid isomerase-like protein|nr:nuclear transport factor 2 family protein [Thermoanaerobaculia bacterium]
MRRSLVILILSCLSALSLSAMPVPPNGLETDFRNMVETERAFSKLSEQKGIKDAFFTYIADDGILFRGGQFVKGKAWTQEHPNPPVGLIWWPTHAGISSSGDLGWTTGPYELKQGNETGHGNFMTVWKKQPDGNWRFVIDFGNDYATPTGDKGTPALRPGQTRATASKTDPAALKDSLLAADRDFGQATGKGTAAAYLARLAEDGVILRNGAHPYMGREAARGGLEKEPSAMTSQPVDGGVSAAGDLGYTYGQAEWKKGDAAAKGSYMRIWEKREGEWKLSAEALVEVAPPPPPAPAPN